MVRARLHRSSADLSEEFWDLNEAIARAAGLLHGEDDGEEILVYDPGQLKVLAIVIRDNGSTRTVKLA